MFFGMLLSPCASRPLSEYDLDVPAQTLRVPSTPAVGDGRARFRQIFCASATLQRTRGEASETCEALRHGLSDESLLPAVPEPAPEANLALRVVLVGGLLSDCVADVAEIYADASEALHERGYRVELIPVSGLSSSRRNAHYIAEFLSRLELQPGERLVLIGHSKGAVDILQFLVDL